MMAEDARDGYLAVRVCTGTFSTHAVTGQGQQEAALCDV